MSETKATDGLKGVMEYAAWTQEVRDQAIKEFVWQFEQFYKQKGEE